MSAFRLDVRDMFDYEKNRSVIRRARIRIIVIGLLIGIVFVSFSGYLANQYVGQTEAQRLNNLKQTAQIARNSIEPILVQYRLKKISKAEAFEQVRNLVRRMVYEDHMGKNYVFMSAYDGTMLVQPFEPRKEMTNMLNLRDSNGVYIIRELIKTAESQNGSGYVSYHYKRPNQEEPEEKISFVMGIPELNCYIGTGKYMTDIRDTEQTYILSVTGLTFFLIFLLAFLVLSAMREVNRQNLMLQQENEALAEAEETLRKSEGKFRELFDSISDLVYTQDLEGRFLSINPAMAKLFNYDPLELIGKKAADFMDPKMKSLFESQYLSGIKTKGYFEGISIYLSKEGREIYLEYRSKRVIPKEGPAYISGMGRDVTERILAKKERKRLGDQLRQAHKMEAMGTLAGGIAHDFNNILAAIVGYSELALAKGKDGGGGTREIQEVLISANRAKELITRILTFSRKVDPEMKPVALNLEIVQVGKMLERTIPRMVEIRLNLAENLHSVNGDAVQLNQLLMNLGSNASDAMSEGGRLVFQTENMTLDRRGAQRLFNAAPGKYVLLTVSDTGHGMDKATQEHIFDPFYTRKEVGQGTGLGLSVVYGIVKSHDGFIICDSKSGEGTTFKIYVPALDSPIKPETATPATPGSMVPGGDEVILLVDDEASLRDLGQEILSRYGYQVLPASSGEEALEIYRQQEVIDLVILDVSMPGMGGGKCLTELLKINPGARVIISSGYSLDGPIQEILSSGASGFVAKPFSISNLLITIRQVLDP